MKKFIAIALMAIMLVAVASTASATVHVNNPTTFSIYVDSKDEDAPHIDATAETYKNTKSVHAIYVEHWVTGGSSEYTNHFRGRKTSVYGGTRTNCGAKWVTVGQKIPVESSSIVYGAYYSVSGRGNTNHYNYDGVAHVTLHGNLYINPTQD